MAKFATVRDLKNQTTSLIREAERGKTVVVTRRGKLVATLKPFEQRDLDLKKVRYPTSLYAAKICPKLAIVLEDENTGARIFPGPDDKPRNQLDISE